jgi:hypothetical protein
MVISEKVLPGGREATGGKTKYYPAFRARKLVFYPWRDGVEDSTQITPAWRLALKECIHPLH